MHTKMLTPSLWFERFKRFEVRFTLKFNDIKRAIKWHILGGKYFFNRYTPEILKAHKWCFIVGCNNSGTSLLQNLLESSGLISTFPHEGQRYTNVLTRASRRGYERVWSEFNQDLKLTGNDSLDCVPRLLHDWMTELPLPIKEIILEKTTANAVRLTWLQEAFPRSCFIGLVRNGYAVTEGISRKGEKSVERGARHWNLINKIMLQDSENLDNYLQIRYEDLVEEPQNVIEQIAEMISQDSDELNKEIKRQFVLNAVADSSMVNIRNYNDESIARLSHEEIRKIHNEAMEMLDYFGYEANV